MNRVDRLSVALTTDLYGDLWQSSIDLFHKGGPIFDIVFDLFYYCFRFRCILISSTNFILEQKFQLIFVHARDIIEAYNHENKRVIYLFIYLFVKEVYFLTRSSESRAHFTIPNKKVNFTNQWSVDRKVWVGCGCKRCCYHGNENGDYNQASDDPHNTEHTTEKGLGRAITITIEKEESGLKNLLHLANIFTGLQGFISS